MINMMSAVSCTKMRRIFSLKKKNYLNYINKTYFDNLRKVNDSNNKHNCNHYGIMQNDNYRKTKNIQLQLLIGFLYQFCEFN